MSSFSRNQPTIFSVSDKYRVSRSRFLVRAALTVLSVLLLSSSGVASGQTTPATEGGASPDSGDCTSDGICKADSGRSDGGGNTDTSPTPPPTSPGPTNPRAMYLSNNTVGGEVLLFPYFALGNGQITTITVTNSADHVKAVKFTINEGLQGAEVIGFHLYLGPKDEFSLQLAKDSNGDGGAMIHSDSTCTVPGFRNTWIPFRDYLIDEGTTDQIDTLSRTLTGSVAVVEMGQWDPDNSVKGAKAAAGAAGTDANACQALVEAWSQSFSEEPDKPWYGSWLDDASDEAMSWQGGGLSGRATVRQQKFDGFNYGYETVVDYSPTVIADFARQRISAEYHKYPGGSSTANYPNPTLSAGTLNFQPCTSVTSDCGTTEMHRAASGLEALSGLLSLAQIGPLLNSQVAEDSAVSWILTMPTKIFHTRSTTDLGPFANKWGSSLEPACDDISVGTPSGAENSILFNPGAVSLCAAVNILQLSAGNSTPLSTEPWLESTFQGSGSFESLAINLTQKNPTQRARDRRLSSSIAYGNDTDVVGLPVIAIPVYQTFFGDYDSSQASSSVERINTRLTISASNPSFPSPGSAEVTTYIANASGNAIDSVSGVCQNTTSSEIKTAVSGATGLTFSSLSAGSYECYVEASVARGTSERDYFSVVIGLPEPPVITDWETDDGTITLYFRDPTAAQQAANSFMAQCISDTDELFTVSGDTSPLTIAGLNSSQSFVCSVTGENAQGLSAPSDTTAPITPEFTFKGLPIWLLYEATKQAQ